MSVKENQTRSMATNFSTREETTGEKIIEGYFAVFNQEQSFGQALLKKFHQKLSTAL